MTSLVDQLKAMAHPARFAILEALSRGEMNVSEIERETGARQPGLSQQLAVLRDAGLVQSRRVAKLVFYALNDSALSRVRSALDPLWSRSPPRAASQYQSHDGVAVFASLTRGS